MSDSVLKPLVENGAAKTNCDIERRIEKGRWEYFQRPPG
jgi:hypothetical protein